METWPVGIQQLVNADGFQKKLGSTSIRSDMDIGPAKVRNRFTDAVDTYSVSILCSFDEYQIFETFYKIQLGNGVLPFLFVDPLSQTEQTYRFNDDPQMTPLGGLEFRIEMSWEKLP